MGVQQLLGPTPMKMGGSNQKEDEHDEEDEKEEK